MILQEFLGKVYQVTANCHIRDHVSCAPLIGTTSECECSCHDAERQVRA